MQGNYAGHISNLGETIELRAHDGTLISSINTPFVPSAVQEFLRVTELHYNPPGSGDLTAFIELKNISGGPAEVTLDLTGVRITDGPSAPFDFTGSHVTTLAAGEFVLVVKDQTAFTAAYPGVNPAIIAGDFQGSLSNGGEIVKLEDAQNSTILEFKYEDGDDPGEEAWHPETDGAGFSLVIVGEAGPVENWESGTGWRSSALLNGSPGTDDPTPAAGDANGDGITDRADITRLLNDFGTATGSNRFLGDLTSDRKTTLDDLAVLQANLGSVAISSLPALEVNAVPVSLVVSTNAVYPINVQSSKFADAIQPRERVFADLADRAEESSNEHFTSSAATRPRRESLQRSSHVPANANSDHLSVYGEALNSLILEWTGEDKLFDSISTANGRQEKVAHDGRMMWY